MRTLTNVALSVSAAALFTGCGGSQLPMRAPAASPAIAQRFVRNGVVQYFSNYYTNGLLEYDYPKSESPIGSIDYVFTQTLLAVWKNGKFKGDYRDFHKSIVKLMPPTQTPNFFTIGPANYRFEEQEPFTV